MKKAITELSKGEFCTLVERTDVENALNEIVISRQGFVDKKEEIRTGLIEIAFFKRLFCHKR